MVLDFDTKLDEAKAEIAFSGEKAEFLVSDMHVPNSLEVIETRYSKALLGVVELVNERYKTKLKEPFNLYNWVEHNSSDELAYFLSETGSNCLNYAETKSPHKLTVYLGSKGFIVAVSQQGRGFNARDILTRKVKQNEGAGFSFFDRCSSVVFFDDPLNARVVCFRYLL